jgi:NAD(P)-dependent dehydrogenase (short-subunit alcohol dehydrogenase family)
MNSRITKNALIVGGSTGIGLDTAKRLGARGATVTISGRDAAKLEAAAAAIKQAGSGIPFLSCSCGEIILDEGSAIST